jgi:hypothetical protein
MRSGDGDDVVDVALARRGVREPRGRKRSAAAKRGDVLLQRVSESRRRRAGSLRGALSERHRVRRCLTTADPSVGGFVAVAATKWRRRQAVARGRADGGDGGGEGDVDAVVVVVVAAVAVEECPSDGCGFL